MDQGHQHIQEVVAGRDRNLYELNPVTDASTLIGPTGVAFIGGMSLRVLR